MVRDYGITPELVHYACLVDLLARGGLLDEAKDVIGTMPMEPDASIWRALIGACRIYSNTHMAKTAFEKLIELEPTNAGLCVIIQHLCSFRSLVRAGDKSHPKSKNIYKKLTFLLTSAKEMGYVHDLKWVLHDEDD
ncbi:tetratricopeptide-like helical domain, DYW domain protein [Artemisia annua]|uniref:Tetratricopeptide-like helical domain, DYW domain protein n=1 Tax=Artemisia annua TaxID=35608 RepID=A0A2U1PTH4_ARTAN|nr:tetratricopeptide-like helical domain, DYW domain protein [Artemisia annua]